MTGFRFHMSFYRSAVGTYRHDRRGSRKTRLFDSSVPGCPGCRHSRARTLQQIDGMLKVVNAYGPHNGMHPVFVSMRPEVINLVALSHEKRPLHYSVLRDFIFTHPSMSEGIK